MSDAWLSPSGEIFEVAKFQHDDFAYKLLFNEYGDILDDHMNNNYQSATDMLHSKGWVRIKYNSMYLPKIQIMGSTIDLTKPMRNTISPRMNNKQLNIAKKLCDISNTSLHQAINDKRFW